ncbi:MAG: M1 family aminopeptidase [Proteobacteria bacterium]|nr:M1 family aminopeptidase [Pseudomonadota bacterium]MDA1324217.1 M1 family aminopeptidase [Pseudomonadota bacterium]
MTRVVGAVLAAAMLVSPVTSSVLQAAEPASPIHHAAEIRLDPESRQITVSDVITVSGRSEIHFRLASWMTIKSLLLDRRPIPIPAASEAWRTSLPDQGRHQIDLSLQGTVPAQPAGRGNGSAQRAAMGPDGGYLFEGAGWIPDTGDDHVSYRLHVEVPVPYRAIATGRLGEETINGTTYSATFFTSSPAAPPALFVGPYDVRERQVDAIRIRTYFHRDLANLTEIYLRDSARYLKRYQTEIGPYPYGDFHVISAPIPVGLGFPNLTYMGRQVLPLPFIRDRSLAHEVLHNWWGNGITVDYRTGNWAEGLTTYMADYALAAEKDADGGQRMRLAWLRDYAALPADRDSPVTRFTAKHNAAAQVIGYNKVALIFHMLRRELGDVAFAKALRQFWQQRQGGRAGWMDLRRAFESASGRELGWFFDQWLDRAGAPRLRLSQVGVEAPTDQGGYRLRFIIRQDPPAYRLTIPVAVETKAGLRHELITMAGNETVATLDLTAQPLALHIDPALDLFRRLLPGEAPPILRDVILASDAVTVIAAADPAMHEVAQQLARRLLDKPVRSLPAGSSMLKAAPLLIIGETREVAALLAGHGLAGIPNKLAGRGTSRVWTASWRDNHPLLVVTADNTKALQALLRPLPHYGSRSYLVFDGRQAIDKGIWPATGSPLSHRFN